MIADTNAAFPTIAPMTLRRPHEPLAQTRERPAGLVRPARPCRPAGRGLLAGSRAVIRAGGLTAPWDCVLASVRVVWCD